MTGFIQSSMFCFSSQSDKPVNREWKGVAPGLNDTEQTGHTNMAGWLHNLAESSPVSVTFSADLFLIFTFITEFFS